jgi:hypothetical protein
MIKDIAQRVAQRPEIKRTIYPVADTLLYALGHLSAQICGLQNTVVVAASPRGGSTWLAELLSHQPGAVVLWEPLHPGNNPVCRKHGFGWQNYIPEGVEWEGQKRYLEDILTGRDLSTRLLTSLELDFKALVSPRKSYVVKFVNANMILQEIVEEFSVPAVQMIRHPCAVVSSQLEHGSWGHIDKNNMTIPNGLLEDYPHFGDVLSGVKKKEELLAFEWGVQNYVPLSSKEALPWYLVTYERMVLEGRKEIKKISDILDLSIASDIVRLKKPSATASREQIEQPEERLLKWKSKLSAKQADNILQVAHALGIDYYTKSATPHFSRLPRHVGSKES